ncbi:MAG: hypothetical protein AAGA30_00970 [Planctomycetota bacterium]
MSNKPKIGQGALKAAGRQGLKELGRALQALPTSQPFVEEPGQIGTATTQAVSQQTGVSQPVKFSDEQTMKGFKAMNGPEVNDTPEQIVQLEVNQPELEPAQEESILDSLVENAQAMEAEREMQMDLE